MSETDKINKVRKLVEIVVKNTKNVMNGRINHRSADQEAKATQRLLEELLGREPTEQELNLALTV